MWTSKPVSAACPRCAGRCELTLAMHADGPPYPSLAGAQLKFGVSVKPKLYCVGMADPPLGEPMWDACGWFILGRVEGDQAVFDRV